jgi:hypothetical protein
MMEAAGTSETSVGIQLRTWQYNPEDSELNIRIILRNNFKQNKHYYLPALEGNKPLYFSRLKG